MKKGIALVSVLLLLCSFALAEDLSGMTDDQLLALKSRIITELETRHPVETTTLHFKDGGPWVLANSDGVKIYLTGRRMHDYPFYRMEAVFENESGRTLSAWADEYKLDGWNLSGGMICSSLKSGEKKVSELRFNINEALLSSFDDMKDLTFTVVTKDSDYQTVKNYGSFCLKFNEVD